MAIENLLKTIKKRALAAGLMSAICGCGNTEANDPIFIYPRSLYGIYEMNWKEIEDTDERNPEPEGKWDIEILTLGSDKRVKFTTLSRHTFDRDLKYGLICDSWPEIPMFSIEWYMHTVCGNITDDGKVDLLVSVDIYQMSENIEHLAFDISGNKKPGEEQ